MSSKKKTLLSFVAKNNDPYSDRGGTQMGAILSLVVELMKEPYNTVFDKILLFYSPDTEKNACQTKELLNATVQASSVELIGLKGLSDPTDYYSIIRELGPHLLRLKDEESEKFIATASGTPQMHACWLWLVETNDFPATIYYKRRPEFEGQSLVVKYNFSIPRFPFLRATPEEKEIPSEWLNKAREIGIIGSDNGLLEALKKAARAAITPYHVILLADSGSGKELFAKFIHKISGRKGEFTPVNCSTITENLFESAFFGHTADAYTGANKYKKGYFEMAQGGSLFLDELGSLPVEQQAKLLRVIEDRKILPVGADQYKKVDVRIIAATNENLLKAMREATFRADLYYRLSVITIEIPPLRKRDKNDLKDLIDHFLNKANIENSKSKTLSSSAYKKLLKHHWPGNVRELENTIIHAFALSEKNEINDKEIVFKDDGLGNQLKGITIPKNRTLKQFLLDIEKHVMEEALAQTNGNQAEAASILGYNDKTFSRRIKELIKSSQN